MLVITLLIAVGLLLLFLETLLPGLIAGAIGMLLLAGAVVYAYLEMGIRTGNLTLLVVCISLIIATILWVRFFPDSAIARLFVSTSMVGNIDAEKPELLDQTGVFFKVLQQLLHVFF